MSIYTVEHTSKEYLESSNHIKIVNRGENWHLEKNVNVSINYNSVLLTLHLSPTEYCMPAAIEKSCFC